MFRFRKLGEGLDLWRKAGLMAGRHLPVAEKE
jgi:hypothetical protein